MKRLILIVSILGLMVGLTVTPVFAIETTLTTPLVITNPITVMKQFSFTITPSTNEVTAEMRLLDAGSNIVQIKQCSFVDPAVTNALITSGKVGQKYIDVMAGFIQTKCKGLWNITGTDQ